MKLFWIGEVSEIYAGNSVEQIAEYMGDTELYELIAEGIFGEVTDLNHKVTDEEGETSTLQELLDEAEGPCQLTTAHQ